MHLSIDNHRLYKVPELSKILSLPISSVRLLLRENKIKATKLGKHWYITGQEIKSRFNIKGGYHGIESN